MRPQGISIFAPHHKIGIIVAAPGRRTCLKITRGPIELHHRLSIEHIGHPDRLIGAHGLGGVICSGKIRPLTDIPRTISHNTQGCLEPPFQTIRYCHDVIHQRMRINAV